MSGQPGHPLGQYFILALATISKVITITVRPRLKVLMTVPLTGDAATLPLLAWQFVVIQNPSYTKVVDPVLTFARDHSLHFYQVSINLSDKIVFIPVQTIRLDYPLLSMHWLNTRLLGLISHDHQFHLLDVRSSEQLETLDLSPTHLVYQTQFFKSLATGGNVSPALSLAGEAAVYGSTVAFPGQLVVLGAGSLQVLLLRTWQERLDHLVKTFGSPLPALLLGLDFYQDPGRGLVGLRGSRDRKRALISLKVVGLLKQFLSTAFTSQFPAEGGMATLTKYFNEIVPPCLEVCVRLGQTDLLFDAVWNTFSQDPFSLAVYLESLEPYILSDQLVRLPTSVVQQFVTHYEARGKLEGLEACLTHLAVDCLDIHQAISVSEKHKLYDALISIHNRALQDYITPTEKLLRVVAAVNPVTPEVTKLGNKLLVYISQCLAGRGYPWGEIPKERVRQVKYDVFSTITLPVGREGEPSYPHLRTLLNFDTQAFLNVLSIAFQEEEFTSEVGRCQQQRLLELLLKVKMYSLRS